MIRHLGGRSAVIFAALLASCQAKERSDLPERTTTADAAAPDAAGEISSRSPDGEGAEAADVRAGADAPPDLAPGMAEDAAGAEVGAGADAAPPSPLDGMGTVELVHDGFQFVEGVRWVPSLSKFLVSDPFAAIIYTLTPPAQLDVYRAMSNGANCLDLDPDGHLVTAEIRGAVTRQLADGSWADAIKDYQGLTLSSPNDIAALPDGSIFFSDLGGQTELLRIDPAGALSYALPTADTVGINGIALSPGKDVLYVGFMASQLIRAFDVRNGELSGMRTVVPTTDQNPDGMCLDADGNLYVGTQNGVQVFDPRTGHFWGLIGLPGLGPMDRASECAFADADARTLYISAVTKLYRVRLARPGVY